MIWRTPRTLRGGSRLSGGWGLLFLCTRRCFCWRVSWRGRALVLPTPVCVCVCIRSFQWVYPESNQFVPQCETCRATASLNRAPLCLPKKPHQWHARACIICQSGTSSLDIIGARDTVGVNQELEKQSPSRGVVLQSCTYKLVLNTSANCMHYAFSSWVQPAEYQKVTWFFRK